MPIIVGKNRVHLFELHVSLACEGKLKRQDFKWFPAIWRDLITDFLGLGWTLGPFPFASPVMLIADELEPRLRNLKRKQILDLCSGSGKAPTNLHLIFESRGNFPL
jgi:hypothetical protein